MANLMSLVQELRERIASSASSSPNNRHDDVLESRYRAVLPRLLHTYVIPSPSANEKEMIAVLKLLSRTAEDFPGVFDHGKAAAVIPVIGHILPIFAEPGFRPRHGAIMDTVGSLLTLLRKGDRDAYRQFFMDAMLLSEDLVYCVSFFDGRRSGEPKRLLLKSFVESFVRICNEHALPGDVPDCNPPINKEGILIDLTNRERLLPFATSIVKLLCKCLSEGTLYVEGLLDASCVLAVCKLLCFRDADLHMACFEFGRLIGAGKNFEIIPVEKLIQSITIILCDNIEAAPESRSVAYDNSLGACLLSLLSCCSDDVVMSTAADIMSIFPQSMLKTGSLELKAALSSAYVRIVNTCPPCSWKPECLICMLGSSKPHFHLIDCFRVAVSRLGPHVVGRITTLEHNTDSSLAKDNECVSANVGDKRSIQDFKTIETKRQKINDCSGSKCHDVFMAVSSFTDVGEKEYADFMWSSLNLLVGFLEPPGDQISSLAAETSLAAICTLCIVFSEHPHAELSLLIFRQMFKWIPWIFQQAQQGLLFPLDLSIFLEAVHCLLLLRGSLPKESKHMIFEKTDNIGGVLRPLLKLPWNYIPSIIEAHPPWKAKCLSFRIQSRAGCITQYEVDLDILDLGLHDEEEKVRTEAVISIPMIVILSGFGLLPHMFKRLEFLKKEKNEQVKKMAVLSLGHLACLYGYYNGVAAFLEAECKLYFTKDKYKEDSHMDHLLLGFWCSKCDRSNAVDFGSCSEILLPSMLKSDSHLICDYTHLQSLFFELLYDQSS